MLPGSVRLHAVAPASLVVPSGRSLKSSLQIAGKVHNPVAPLSRSDPPELPIRFAEALISPHISCDAVAVATGVWSTTICIWSASKVQGALPFTVIVRVTVCPASPATELYVAVSEVALDIVPPPPD